MPFNSCAPGSRLKLKHVAPSVVTFWRTLSKAETPNELTRDVSFNGFAPCLEQPTVLKLHVGLAAKTNVAASRSADE